MAWRAGLAAAIMVALAAGLRPDAFFSGDSGVKLIAARNAVAHPDRPFEIDFPRIAGREVPYVDDLFVVHGGHAHALQSPLFPVASAAFVHLWGVRGAYVLPILSFVLLLVAMERLRAQALPRLPSLTFYVIVLTANPVLFYALEVWEHAPAVALTAAATAAAWRGSRRGALAAGAFGGLAIILRPEAIWYIGALGLFAPVRHRRDRIAMAAATLALLAPAAMANYLHFGDPLGAHLRAVVDPIGRSWLQARQARAAVWFAPSALLAAAGAVLVAAAWIAKTPRASGMSQVIGLAGAAAIGLAAAAGLLARESLWQLWPAGAMVFVPHEYPGARRWRGLALVSIAAMFLTSHHDGGAQWGPRYLLTATPALLVLTAIAADSLAGSARPWRRLRSAFVAAVLLLAAFTSRNAYRELQASKEDYGAIVTATREFVPEGGVIATDVWWFGQMTAALYGRHTVLPASARAPLAAILRDIEDAKIPAFVLARSTEQGPVVSNRIGCYEPGPPRVVPIRGVVLTPFTWACP